MRMNRWLKVFIIFVLVFQPFYMSGIGNRAAAAELVFTSGDGSAEHPYQIATAEQLNEVRNYLDKHFVLVNDIDLSGFENWEPIGGTTQTDLSPSVFFTGSLDGAGHQISNLKIKRIDSAHVGLFASLRDALIQNLKLENVDVEGHRFVGGLAGSQLFGKVYNVSVSGTVIGPNSDPGQEEKIGGLIGENTSGLITHSTAHVDVVGYTNTGGLVGTNSGTIERSYATGNVTGTSSIGGLVGSSPSNGFSQISNSYASGNVTGQSFIGGIIGYAFGVSIQNSYAIGKVIQTNPNGSGVGGLAGFGEPSITASFYDSTVNPVPNGKGIGKTTEEMQSEETFTGWDFQAIWNLDSESNGGYPSLRPVVITPDQPVVPPAAPAVSADDETNHIVGMDDTMEYSVDNGETWIPYDIENGPAFTGNETVLIRVQATGNIPAGEVTTIYFTENAKADEGVQITRTTSVFAGDNISFLLDEENRLWSLGSNGSGRLGIGKSDMEIGKVNIPVQVNTVSNIVNVSAYKFHVAAIDATGNLYTWGSNDKKQLGLGSTALQVNTPEKVQTDAFDADFGNVVSVATGLWHTLAVKADGTVWAWGDNSNGQLGTGDGLPYEKPVQIAGLHNIVAVAASDRSSMALDKEGHVWTWGNNKNGQLGNGDKLQLNQPKQVANLNDVKEIEMEDYHAAVLKHDGTIWSWGNNTYGKLGNGTTAESLSPVQAKNVSGIKAIAAGTSQTIALDSEGNVWSWGMNSYGLLGHPEVTGDVLEPTIISGLEPIISISTGPYHTLLEKENHTFWGMGMNNNGAIGLEKDTQVMPVEIYFASTLPDQKAIELVKEQLAIGYMQGDSANSVTGNLSFSESGDYGTAITWETSKPDIIEASGTVHRPAETESNEQVIITATISKNEVNVTKEFTVTVKKANSWVRDFDQFTKLSDLEFDTAGNTYVIHSGELLKKSAGSDEWVSMSDETSSGLLDVAITSDGTVYAVQSHYEDYQNANRLLKWTGGGWELAEDGLGHTSGITASGKDLFAFGYTYGDGQLVRGVKMVNENGVFDRTGDQTFVNLSSIATDETGAVYLYERASMPDRPQTLYKLVEDSWISYGMQNVGTKIISLIDVDADGNLYAVGVDQTVQAIVLWNGTLRDQVVDVLDTEDSMSFYNPAAIKKYGDWIYVVTTRGIFKKKIGSADEGNGGTTPTPPGQGGTTPTPPTNGGGETPSTPGDGDGGTPTPPVDGGTVPTPPSDGGSKPTPPGNGGGGTTPTPPKDEDVEEPSEPEVPAPSKPTTEQIVVDVDGEDGSNLTKTPITRTTETDGTVKDKVSMSEEIAKDTVSKAKEKGMDTARIIIPDKEDKVAEITVEIPKSALKQLNEGKLKLEIVTANGVVSIPAASIANFEDDLYFRIIPIKSASEQKKVEERAKAEKLIQDAIQDNTVQVLGRPMEIETNMQNRDVTIVLPIEANLPKDEAKRKEIVDHLGVFIEHSDGTKELLPGKLVNLADGSAGIEFSVTKFSTFTMVYLEGWNDEQQESADPIVHKPYIYGDAGKFRPNAFVTRAQMAAMLARNLDKPSATAATPYRDVKRSHWAYDNIMQMKSEGIMKGVSSSEFNPQGEVTRGQMALIAYRWIQQECKKDASAFGYCNSLTVSEKASYKDVSLQHQAYEAISVLKANDIMTGFEDGSFRPYDKLKRAQAVKVLNRLFKRGPLTGVDRPLFQDVPSTHWAYEEIAEAAMEHTAILDEEGKGKLK